MEFKHIPIMLNECIEGLNIYPDGTYVDCTMGGAGHSREIVSRLSENGIFIGIDKDEDAINVSKGRLKDFKCKKHFIHDDFKNFKQILTELDIKRVDGILIDLGVSSYQIDNADRGFTYRLDAPLDMRMDKRQKLTAEEVVNNYDYDKLVKILFEYGEEPFSKNIVKNIIKVRDQFLIATTKQLVTIIEASIPKKVLFKSNSVAKVFQAIRIEVNSELTALDECVNDMIDSLNPNGRMCVISFHSLEDRIIKNVFRLNSTDCICDKSLPICVCKHKASIKQISGKPITPSNDEQNENTRSGSAKLRIIEKI